MSKSPKSLAIALSTQKHNKKKMALGGAVEAPGRSGHATSAIPGTPAPKPDDKRLPDSETMAKEWSKGSAPAPKPDDKKLPESETMANHFAKGGMIDMEEEISPSDMMSDDERASSIADAIMRKRDKMKMAEGGMVDDGEVDLEANSEEVGRSPYDHMNQDAANKELYDLDQLSPQPMDSNEHGDDLDSDKHDMISAIRAKLKAKRGV